MIGYPKTKRFKSEKYLDFMRELPCIICGKKAEPHHVSINSNSGMGMKPDDLYVLPLCREHHRQIHDIGHETFCTLMQINVWKELFFTTKRFIEDNLK